MVDEETWEAAQTQAERNLNQSRRNVKHNYLMRYRLRCGRCIYTVKCYAKNPGKKGKRGKYYFYYECNARGRTDLARGACSSPTFPADKLDATVWDWVHDLFSEPEVVLEGLREEQARRKEVAQPLYERLDVINDLLADHEAKLVRLLELYLEGGFQKEVLIEHKGRLEDAIDALDKERADLETQLEGAILTDEQVETVIEFTRTVAGGLEAADTDFAKRRQLIEALDLQGVLLLREDGQKQVKVRCVISDAVVLSIASTSTCRCSGRSHCGSDRSG